MPFNIRDEIRGMSLFRNPLSRREASLLILESCLLLLSAIVLGLSASSATGMKHDLGFLWVPTKLQFNLGLAIATFITMLALIILDLTKPPFWHDAHRKKPRTTGTEMTPAAAEAAHSDAADDDSITAGTPAPVPVSNYNPWLRVAVSLVFWLLWAGAIAASVYTCGDLCPATNGLGYLNYANICCNCLETRVMECAAAAGGGGGQYTYVEQRTGRYGVTQAFNSITMVIFLVSTIIWLSFTWSDTSTRRRR